MINPQYAAEAHSIVNCAECERLEEDRDHFRNALGERAEEVQMLRKSNADLATRILELQECQKDSRRLDWLERNSSLGFSELSCNYHITFRYTEKEPESKNIRMKIDQAMNQEEERRQDRISELQAELAKLCRESGEEGVSRFDQKVRTEFPTITVHGMDDEEEG